ncbi:hypothetical protein FACS189419_03480 [Planctomycetales bacterium]|nr:hypothetical protein FACS189419_03480 [Planctomycetales bacterium]
MASKRKPVQLTEKITKKTSKVLTKCLASAGIVILLALLGLVDPSLRDKAADVLGVKNVGGVLDGETAQDPLSSNKKSRLKEGIWQVVHIADGDTIDVVDDNKEKFRIRLIGANTPETVKPNTPVEPYGPEASALTKKMIDESGYKVRIAYDGDQIDKYGRSLAFVYLQLSQGEINLNELLVREGLAHAQLQYRFSKSAKQRLLQAEDEAKKSKKNLWSESH